MMTGKYLDSLPLALLGLAAIGVLAALAASALLPSVGIMATYGIGDNGKSISVARGTVIEIVLDENPTTGYSWIAAVTPGLAVDRSEYVSSASPRRLGASGVHEWTVRATAQGEQRFTAVYRRSWEPVTGKETTFTLDINVT